MSDKFYYRSFRVPRADRSVLAIPELEQASQLVAENRAIFEISRCSLNGRPLAELRSSARREALTIAKSYTASLIEADITIAPADSFVVSGHQPELFHVGVWAKNFALAGIARRCRSVAVNLVIDSDTLTGTAIRIPVGTKEAMSFERISFDVHRPTQPWEEAIIRDREAFTDFGPKVRNRILAIWGFEPLVGTAWKAAVSQMAVSNRLCDGLTAIRTNLERAWGQTNLELPMSRLCASESFLWFAAHLLGRLPQVHAIYNETVSEYRTDHHLRNRLQPVPDLDSGDGWYEAPFWIWKRGDLQRGRLYARRNGGQCELRNEKEIFARFPWTEEGSLDSAIQVLNELPKLGLRLRTRALTTTLFARLCLADLFVHGIGGAKYDEMTDKLFERLFGLKAPRFMTVSATLHLPLGGAFSATDTELRNVKHKLRDLFYNPDRHLTDDASAAKLVQEKTELLSEASAMRQSDQLRGRLTSDQHRNLARIQAELRSHTGNLRAHYQSEQKRIEVQLSANALIRNREYSFALYPEDQVRQFLTPLAN